MTAFDFKNMLGQVKQMQEQLQQKLAAISVEASAGGGQVTVTMNGKKQLTKVDIDPQFLQGGDRDMLQEFVIAAVNEAARRVDEELQQHMSSMTGGINPFNLPGLT